MADDFNGWTLEKAAPEETSGWTLHQAEASPVDARPGVGEALARGAGQGATFGLGDEVGGGLQAIRDVVVGDAPRSLRGLQSAYRYNRDAFRREDDAARAAHPVAFGVSEAAGSIPSTFVPGLNVAKGAKLLPTLARYGAQGALAGFGTSKADTATGDLANAAGGAALSAGTGAAGRLLGVGGRTLTGKVAALDESVARKAAAEAAESTASLKGEAGRAAQDAYKQLEHLRELGGMRQLSPEEAQVASELEAELAEKARAKLLPAAARKAETAQAFAEAAQSEAQRAKDIAAQKLSGGELKQQLGSRLLRYGLPAVGGALAGAAGFGGHGALVGAGSGALMGAGLRPMMHSLKRMASQPVVQRPLLQLGAGLADGLGQTVARSGPAAELQFKPDVAALIAALRAKKEPDPSQWTQEPAP